MADIDMIDADDIDFGVNDHVLDDPNQPQQPLSSTYSAGNDLHQIGAETIASPPEAQYDIVPNAINIQGVDQFKPKDTEAYLGEHFVPIYHIDTRWVHDSSFNYVFSSADAARDALHALTSSEIFEPGNLPPAEQRPAKPYSKFPDTELFVRQMFTSDVKVKGAHALSRFYLNNRKYDPTQRDEQPRNRGRSERRGSSYSNGDFMGSPPSNDYSPGRNQSNRPNAQRHDNCDSRSQRCGSSDSQGQSKLRGDHWSPPRNRDTEGRGRGRHAELFPADRGSGRLRDRSASPVRRDRHNSGNRRSRSPIRGNRRGSHGHDQKRELFDLPSLPQGLGRAQSPGGPSGGRNRNNGRNGNGNGNGNGNRSGQETGARELFDLKTNARDHNRNDNFSAPVADKAARMAAAFAIDTSKYPTPGLASRVTYQDKEKELFPDAPQSGKRDLFAEPVHSAFGSKKHFPHKTEHSNHRRTGATDETKNRPLEERITYPDNKKGSLESRITPRDDEISVRGQASRNPGMNIRGAAQNDYQIKGRGLRPKASDFH